CPIELTQGDKRERNRESSTPGFHQLSHTRGRQTADTQVPRGNVCTLIADCARAVRRVIQGRSRCQRKDTNEDCRDDCTNSAGVDLRGLWAERVPPFHPHGAYAHGDGGPVHRRALPVTLCVCCQCAPGCGRRAFVGQPLRAVGPCAAWPGDCEHLPVSPAHG